MYLDTFISLENTRRLVLHIGLVFVLFFSFTPCAQAQTKEVYNVYPALLEMAAERPDGTLPIIVQKITREATVETVVTLLGGVVTKDLPLIRGFAARLPAHTLTTLALDPGVRWISLDAPMFQAGTPIDTSRLANAYIRTIGADQVWNAYPYLQGRGITVAVVDSGGMDWRDLKQDRDGNNRLLAWAHFSDDPDLHYEDYYGHGTHVMGIIGGNGALSEGEFIGVAPEVNLVTVKVSNDLGQSRASDVISGLQWINQHKDVYNIRVVNLSLNSVVPESYHTSPLDAAVEVLWFNGIVVVVSAGNNGNGSTAAPLHPPANDPFVITVGATDDRGTADIGDDVLTRYSAYGVTADGYAKPDLVAPGHNIVSLIGHPDARLQQEHPGHLVQSTNQSIPYYFRMSGTSMAAPVVTGAVALLLQNEPHLTPDQVKYRLQATARPFPGPQPGSTGAGYLDLYAAIQGTTTESANRGTPASLFLGLEFLWENVDWGSIRWEDVGWSSINWNSINWNGIWDEPDNVRPLNILFLPQLHRDGN